jgi:hypothetical protein
MQLMHITQILTKVATERMRLATTDLVYHCRHFVRIREICCVFIIRYLYIVFSTFDQLLVVTFKSLAATCVEWRQSWTTRN